MTERASAAGGTRPVGEGLFEPADVPDGLPYLIGSRCEMCGETVFPGMRDCPACVTRDSMRPARLRGSGTVHQFVVAQRGPSGFAVPYIQAYVRLDAGPIVYSMISGCSPEEDALKYGQRVEMSIVPVRRDGDVEVMGWKFHPVAESDG